MAKVLLTSTYPEGNAEAARITAQHDQLLFALAQKSTSHTLTTNPEAADVILIYLSYSLFRGRADRRRACVFSHNLRKRYPEKVFVYDLDDHPTKLLPGIFPSLSARSHDPLRQCSGPYIHYLSNSLLDPPALENTAYLYSFMGSLRTCGWRRKLKELSTPNSPIIDTGDYKRGGDVNWNQYQIRFAELLHQSKFILCPRGRGPSSVRLFEVMRAGRVPVIIGDDWLPPAGPRWHEFSIRVREADLMSVPSALAAVETRSSEMGALARKAWEEWFSGEIVFSRMIDACLVLQRGRATSERWLSFREKLKAWYVRETILSICSIRQLRTGGA